MPCKTDLLKLGDHLLNFEEYGNTFYLSLAFENAVRSMLCFDMSAASVSNYLSVFQIFTTESEHVKVV
jgi:hypothetical protein